MFLSFDLLLGELIYLVSILSYHRNLMSLFFKEKLSVCSFQGTSSTSVLPHLLVSQNFFKRPGSHLLSHAVSSIVPSAAQVLTIVFGMGTGVSPERIATRKGVIKFSLGN